MRTVLISGLLILCALACTNANDTNVSMKEYTISMDCMYRFCRTTLYFTIENRNLEPMSFDEDIKVKLKLGKKALISGLKMSMGKETYNGVVKQKSNAVTEYKEFKQTHKFGVILDLTEQEQDWDDKTGFLNITVAPNSTMNVKLSYQEKIEKYSSLGVKLEVNAVPQNVKVDRFVVRAYAKDFSKINDIELYNIQINDGSYVEINSSDIKRGNDTVWKPNPDDLEELNKATMVGYFKADYKTEKGDPKKIIIRDGVFVQYDEPTNFRNCSHSIFLVDVSDSSNVNYGATLEALEVLINNLMENHLFTIFTFARSTEAWSHNTMTGGLHYTPQRATIDMKKKAVAFFEDKLKSTFGSTNLFEALEQALKYGVDAPINNTEIDSSAIIILSDGDATSGKFIDGDKIIENLNLTEKIPIFFLAIGQVYPKQSAFVERLTNLTGGRSIIREVKKEKKSNEKDSDSDYQRQVKDFSTAIRYITSKDWENKTIEQFRSSRLEWDMAAKVEVNGTTVGLTCENFQKKNASKENKTITKINLPAEFREKLEEDSMLDCLKEEERIFFVRYLAYKELLNDLDPKSDGQMEYLVKIAEKYSLVTKHTSLFITKDKESSSRKKRSSESEYEALIRHGHKREKTEQLMTKLTHKKLNFAKTEVLEDKKGLAKIPWLPESQMLALRSNFNPKQRLFFTAYDGDEVISKEKFPKCKIWRKNVIFSNNAFVPGLCLHLRDCLEGISELSIQDFLSTRFCPLRTVDGKNSYIGVCCPT